MNTQKEDVLAAILALAIGFGTRIAEVIEEMSDEISGTDEKEQPPKEELLLLSF